jgi:hypothetical protein
LEKYTIMKWITRRGVKADRVAWFAQSVCGGRTRDHGEDVSFDSIREKYQLTDPALRLLAETVRAADSHPSNRHLSA